MKKLMTFSLLALAALATGMEMTKQTGMVSTVTLDIPPPDCLPTGCSPK